MMPPQGEPISDIDRRFMGVQLATETTRELVRDHQQAITVRLQQQERRCNDLALKVEGLAKMVDQLLSQQKDR